MQVTQVNLRQLRDYVMSRPPTYYRTGIRLHHNADTNMSGLADAQQDADYHTNTLGWSVPGYHVQVDPDQNETYYLMAPMEGKANHIGDGYNTEEIAVCVQGNYCEQYPTPTLAHNLVECLKIVAERYSIDVHPGFHRDVDATACPGYNITHELVNSWVDGGVVSIPQPEQPPVIIQSTTPPADLTFQNKPVAPKPPFTFIQGSGECLGNGDESSQVRDLELCLYYLGYISYTPNTYLFDDYTEAGIKAFQANFCPPADGVYGINTANALDKEVTRRWTGHPVDVVPTPPIAPPVVSDPPAPPIPLAMPDETKTTLQKILALLEQLVSWFKQIFKVS